MIDGEDIATGQSEDCNGNSVPDECESSPAPFGSVIRLGAAGSASSFAIVDLDGDRRADIAVGSGRTNNFGVSLYLRDDENQLALSDEWLSSIREITSIIDADLDGDDDRDLVILDFGGVRGYLNLGPAGFSDRFTVSTRDDMSAIAAADLDGDSFEDVIAIQSTGDLVAVFLSGGDSTFRPLPDVGVASPTGLALGDLDGDGSLEVVITGEDGISILASVGDGTLEPAGLVPSPGEGQRSPVLGDLDQDGRLDLALATDSGILVLWNRGSEGFDVVPAFRLDAGERRATALSLGDVDADGDLDLLVGLSGDGASTEIAFLINGGDRSFGFTSPIPTDAAAEHLHVADLDGDDDGELIVLTRNHDRVDVFLSDGGALPPPPSLMLRQELFELSDRFEPHVSLLRDVDHDGDLDIITMDGETLVMVITNDGGGGFAEGTRYELDGAAEIITMVSVDFDGDGSFDVAANDEITDNLVILLNQGDGTFVQSEEVYPVGEQPAFLVAGDIDGDDHQDLVSVSRADDTIGIFFNLGDATFAPEVAIEVGNYPVGAALGDFDGDDDIDIAVVSSFSSTLSLLFNEGYGTFEDPIDLDIETPRYVTAVDIDADLDLDLVVAFETDSSLGVFLNDGQGRFDPQEPIGLGRRPRSVIACELNRDGFPDLVAADELDASVSILLSVEPGVFAPSLTYRVGQNPRYAIAGDIDGDGDSDLLSANHSSYDFTLFLNETTAPEPPPAYLEGICTELDYHRVSLPTGLDIGVDRETRFLLPVADAPLPALVENISQHASQREFLTATFPEAFPSLTQEEYNLLVARRASRQYYAGQLYRLRSRYGHAYGFDVLVDSGSDIGELLTEEESRTIYEALSGVFTLEPLVYHPRSPDARQVAAAWTAQDVPVWMDLFRRGDVTADGAVDLSDVISLLDHEFRGGAVPSCQDTADVNDDGELDISDAINILRHLFLGVSAVQDPLESCGWDRTADGLSCLEYRACVQ